LLVEGLLLGDTDIDYGIPFLLYRKFFHRSEEPKVLPKIICEADFLVYTKERMEKRTQAHGFFIPIVRSLLCFSKPFLSGKDRRIFMDKTEVIAFSPYLSPKFITILKRYYTERVTVETMSST
jgi:hypothetical protein